MKPYRPVIVLVPDNLNWVTGRWAKNVVQHWSTNFVIYIIPFAEFSERPLRVAEIMKFCDIAHCLVPQLFSFVREFGLRYGGKNIQYIGTVNHVIDLSELQHLFMADKVMTICQRYFQEVRNYCPEKLEVYKIGYGVDPKLFRKVDKIKARASLGISRDSWVIGFSSKPNSDDRGRKGIDRFTKLLHSLEKLADREIVFLTIGPEWDQYFKKHHFSKIIPKHLGFVVDRKVRYFYSALDCYLCTSRIEGGPMPVFEAMACEATVLTTPVGMVPEYIRHGVNGFLLKDWDHDYNVSLLLEVLYGSKTKCILPESPRLIIEHYMGWSSALSEIGSMYNLPSVGSEARTKVSHIKWNAEMNLLEWLRWKVLCSNRLRPINSIKAKFFTKAHRLALKIFR